MKKIVSLIIVLVMLLTVATAYAASPCSLCGRTHKLTNRNKCPEACGSDSHGNSHHYYECENWDGYCGFCKTNVTDHGTDTCPHYAMSWSDTYGVWKANDYVTADMNARSPIYCGFCQHYGYHYESECLRNPNPATPVPTATPTPMPTATPTPMPTATPTPMPTATPTPMPTATPAPTATACAHGNYYERDIQTVDSSYFFAEERCFERSTKREVVCWACNEVVNWYIATENVAHNYNSDYRCVKCGYVKPGMITAAPTATPVPTATPKPTATQTPIVTAVPNVEICTHPRRTATKIGSYLISLFATEDCCRKEATVYDVVCEDCGLWLYEYTDEKKAMIVKEHTYGPAGVCQFCGHIKQIAVVTAEPTMVPTATPIAEATAVPTATPIAEATVVPTATPIVMSVVHSARQSIDWFTVVVVIILIIVAIVAINELRKK